MKKFALIASSFLTISSASFASDFSSSFSTDEIENFCTKSSPCYHDGDGWHPVNSASDNPWNSYTIPTFVVDTAVIVGVSFVAPVVHSIFDRFLDYAAYKWHSWRGLRDSGGVAQTDQLRRMANSAGNIENVAEAIRNPFLQSLISADDQKESLKLISDAIEKSPEQTNLLLGQMIKETKKGQENSSQLIQHLVQQQKELTALALSIQKSQEDARSALAVQFNQSQEKTSKSFVLALTSFTEALKELKSKDD